jgi:hypothetical protein
MWMHQDVTFDAQEPIGWIRNLIKVNLHNNFGIIGPAGVYVRDDGSIKGMDFSNWEYNFSFHKTQTIDEFCLIGLRKNNLKFGEYLDHFHFYGADICLTAIQNGLSNYVIKIPITHHSGGESNLKNGDGYEKYIEQSKKLVYRWREYFNRITTTTMHYRNGYFHWFLGELLGLEPNKQVDFMENKKFTKNKKHYLL